MARTPQGTRPEPPRQERGSNLSWIFFLLILARPLWGILRATVGPQVSDTQLWIVVAGVFGLVALALLAPRTMNRGASAPRLPTPIAPRLPTPAQTAPRRYSDPSMRPPRFEPIITGKVLVAGALLFGLMSIVFLMLWLA